MYSCKGRRGRRRGRDIATTQNTPEEASTLRHALAKATFSRLFDWLVQRANKAFDKSDQSQFIGILDIFGFEDMATNGFEQVFINTTNEQLQKVFNDLVFEAEAEEYTIARPSTGTRPASRRQHALY